VAASIQGQKVLDLQNSAIKSSQFLLPQGGWDRNHSLVHFQNRLLPIWCLLYFNFSLTS